MSLILSCVSFGQKTIEKGFEELQKKNFGIAETQFRKGLKKSTCVASCGLSQLYCTKDYRNLDSAYYYMFMSDTSWAAVPEKLKLAWKTDFSFDRNTIDMQKQSVSQLCFESIEMQPSVYAWNQFIRVHPHYSSLNTVIYLRDQLAFEIAKKKNSSQALKNYMDTLPESSFIADAQMLYDDLEYAELTAAGDLASFTFFYENCPKNKHLMEAVKEIYRLSTLNHSLQEYVQFARAFPSSPYVNEAWRYVYQLYLKEYSVEKYAAFQREFPDYPFMQELAVDLDLFQMNLFPVTKQGKFGYMNVKGELVISAEYNEAYAFQDGLAVVSKNELFGLIDKKNQVVIPFQFDEMSEFTQNRSIVQKESKFGVIDRQGKIIFPLIYDDIVMLHPGVYEVMEGDSTHYLDGNGQKISWSQAEDKPSFAQTMSKLHPEFELVGDLDRGSNRAVVKKAGQLNYIDSTGKLVLVTPMEWFPDALNLAKYKSSYAVFRKKEKYGLMDLSGKMVQKNVYEASGPFTGYWPVKDKGNWALLDSKGKVVLPFEYNFIRYVDELGYLIERGGLFGLLNASAKIVLPVSFSNIKNFESNYFLVSVDEKYGLYSKEGKEILPLQYDRIQRYDSEALVLYESGKMTYYFPKSHSFLSLIE